MGDGLVAEDVDVVARVDKQDGQPVGVAHGAVFLHSGKPFHYIAAAGVGGDGDEQSVSRLGSGGAYKGFGEEGAAFYREAVVGDAEVAEEFVHEEDVVAPFFVQAGVAVAEVEHVEAAVVEAGKVNTHGCQR